MAPPPQPRQLTEEESRRLDEQEEDTLRELRLFLRDVTNRLSQDKRFKAFTKPVDLEEVAVHVPHFLSLNSSPISCFQFYPTHSSKNTLVHLHRFQIMLK